MPKTSEMRESKFLRKEDVGRGALATITGCRQYNVAAAGADPDPKWCLTLAEFDKPFVLNSTNIQLIEHVTGSDDTDHWTGHTIVLYTDPNVSYGGKLVGGIRVRAPKSGSVPPRKMAPIPVAAGPMPTADEIFDDDIPFAWMIGMVGTAMMLSSAAPILL